MTLATSGAQPHDLLSDDTLSDGTDATPAVKTALDCDILTLARDARAHEQGAHSKQAVAHDPMDALFKPLGNKDVACVLKVAGR